jgi:hypothetical protein
MKGPMTPLQQIAMGLVIVGLDTSSAYDWYPDVLGWVLVLMGVSRFNAAARSTLTYAALLGAATSGVLWFPQVRKPFFDVDLSLVWAAFLPDLIFCFLLCRVLEQLARPTDPKGAVHFGSLKVLFVLLAIAPVIAVSAEQEPWLAYVDLGKVIALVWLIWMLFSRNSREYAKPPATTGATGGSGNS